MYRCTIVFIIFIWLTNFTSAQHSCVRYDQTREGFLVFHPIKTDKNGNIAPWNADNNPEAFHDILLRTWSFWDTMKRDINGLPYYMNHQVWWQRGNDPRGMGGDQLAMALCSFQLLYMYTGNEKIKETMRFIAEHYITNGLSSPNSVWPNIPYPYNSFIYSEKFDGDMIIGKNFTQPDKAGSFGFELLKLYKMSKQRSFGHAYEELYLEYALNIAQTLATKTQEGDENNSPLPFKVNAVTGEIGILKGNYGKGKTTDVSSGYSTNWAATLNLWESLITMKKGDTALLKSAHQKLLSWCKRYPVNNQKWGPFFEDIPGWSDTQINAITFAQYMMEHPQYFPEYKSQVPLIFNWVYQKLGNKNWEKYGVLAINEQTAYQTPGNSHTSRQGSAELQWAALTGDTILKGSAVLKLIWATYMVDDDGKNCYPNDEVWLTDGYGDYIRHYIRAMAAFPDLAPPQNHILYSSSIVSQVDYFPDINKRMAKYITDEEKDFVQIYYKTFDNKSIETIRMASKPSKITLDWKPIMEDISFKTNTWKWTPLKEGGILRINKNGHEVKVFK